MHILFLHASLLRSILLGVLRMISGAMPETSIFKLTCSSNILEKYMTRS